MAKVRVLHGECKEIERTLAKLDFKKHIAKLHKEGDRSERMLAWLTREDRDRQPIGAIRTSENIIHHTQGEINRAFMDYYKVLYSDLNPPQHTEIEQFLHNTQLPQLTNEQREDLEEPLTLGEITHAIRQIAHSKTPGMDGLPIEYYA